MGWWWSRVWGGTAAAAAAACSSRLCRRCCASRGCLLRATRATRVRVPVFCPPLQTAGLLLPRCWFWRTAAACLVEGSFRSPGPPLPSQTQCRRSHTLAPTSPLARNAPLPLSPAGCRRGAGALGPPVGLPARPAQRHEHRPLPVGRWAARPAQWGVAPYVAAAGGEPSSVRPPAVTAGLSDGQLGPLLMSLPPPSARSHPLTPAVPLPLPLLCHHGTAAARLRYLYILSGVGSLLAAAHLLPRLAPWMS